ncbi:MAG: hypothetical protein KKG10_13490, partial [Proteobacteria bacterium]|nr:hypothetical protein [Pseudomonadota bacterium]
FSDEQTARILKPDLSSQIWRQETHQEPCGGRLLRPNLSLAWGRKNNWFLISVQFPAPIVLNQDRSQATMASREPGLHSGC